MKLHPLRHNVVLLAAFLAGGVALQVALGNVRMYGLLPVVGALIGLNLRYNRRSERGRARIDERYDRVIQSGALVGFVAMLYATVGYAFYVSMTGGISVSEETILLSVVGLVSVVLVSGYYWLSRKASNWSED
jgi:glucose uptake protein GlcU